MLTSALLSQYEAALKMLRAAIQATPDFVWDSDDYENRTWRLAYHTLYYTKIYLAPSFESFSAWDGVIESAESLGGSCHGPCACNPDGRKTHQRPFRTCRHTGRRILERVSALRDASRAD